MNLIHHDFVAGMLDCKLTYAQTTASNTPMVLFLLTILHYQTHNTPQNVVVAEVFLTKRPNKDYQDIIVRIQANRLATKVKIADIEDNIHVLRLTTLNEHGLKRVKKHHQAWHFLNRSLVQNEMVAT